MKKITLIDLIDEGKEYVLPNKGEITLGRSSENDIQIKNNGVSREHCRIYRIGNKIGIMDSKSKNGTYLGNQKLLKNKKYLLKDSYEFRLSNYKLKIIISDEENSERDLEKELERELDKSDAEDTDYDFTKDF